MQRREYLTAAGGAALGTALAGCFGDGSGGSTGTLATRVTDQPGDIGDFASCLVTITEIRVAPAGDDADDATASATGTDTTGTTTSTATEDEDGADDADEPDEDVQEADDDGDDEDGDDEGLETYDVEDTEADLVELQDGNTELVAETELEPGDYEFLQLIVSEVDATLDGGGDAEVTTPGNAPLKFKQPFEIRADTTTTFTADFTPVKRGKTGSYLLKPVATGTEVSYE